MFQITAGCYFLLEYSSHFVSNLIILNSIEPKLRNLPFYRPDLQFSFGMVETVENDSFTKPNEQFFGRRAKPRESFVAGMPHGTIIGRRVCIRLWVKAWVARGCAGRVRVRRSQAAGLAAALGLIWVLGRNGLGLGTWVLLGLQTHVCRLL